MNDRQPFSPAGMTPGAPPAAATDVLLARLLLAAFAIAAVAVLSLPQARAVSAGFGWIPLWLLATPLSAWLALQLRRRVLRGDGVAASLRRRRRTVAGPVRRRAGVGARGAVRVNAARAG